MKKIGLFILIVITFFAMIFLQPAVCFSQAAQADTDTEKAIKAAQEALNYTAGNLRDPFTLSLPQQQATISTGPAIEATLPQFTIQGFIWGSSLPQAIINGKVYSVGDSVEGAKITKIDKSGITVLFNDKYYTLR